MCLAAYDNVRELLSNVALSDDESAEDEKKEKRARHNGTVLVCTSFWETGTQTEQTLSADTECESYLSDKSVSCADALQWPFYLHITFCRRTVILVV